MPGTAPPTTPPDETVLIMDNVGAMRAQTALVYPQGG